MTPIRTLPTRTTYTTNTTPPNQHPCITSAPTSHQLCVPAKHTNNIAVLLQSSRSKIVQQATASVAL
eukprot:5850339-Prorocentrum_lima.AAC.1